MPTTPLSPSDERRLHPVGRGRYVETVFLGLWLIGWVVGEAVALVFFGASCVSLLAATAGHSVAFGPLAQAPGDGFASVVVFFLIVWLTLWTAAGWAAGSSFLRQVAGEDRAAVTPEGLRVVRRAGPFRRTRILPRPSIRRVRLRLRDKAVVADTPDGTITIAELGALDDRRSLHRWLVERLTPPDPDHAVRLERETPPHQWSTAIQGMDTIMTSPPPRARRIQATIGWAVTAVVSLGWVGVFRGDVIEPEPLGPGQWAAVTVTALSAIGALWLTLARREWMLRPGVMRLRRRVGSLVLHERAFHHGTLELEHYVDSDNDDTYRLIVRDGSRRRILDRALHDQFELLAFGEWLGARTGFPFHRPSP